jgi:prevent-host-death family protein
MRSFTTADLNKHVGSVTEAAMREPVVITHHRRPRFVLMSVESYKQLAEQQADRQQRFMLDTIPDDLREGLLALADSDENTDDRGD